MRPDIDVIVREVGLRDGLQIHPVFMPTERKLAWIQAEAAAGVSEIEVTSYVPARIIPQFADAEEVTHARAGHPGPDRFGPDPEPARRRARHRAGRAQAQFRHVGEPDAQPEERAARARGIGGRLPAHRGTGPRAAGRAPPAHRRRPGDGAGLLLRRPGSGGRRGALCGGARRGRRRRAGGARHRRLRRSRAGAPRCSRR